MAENPTDRTQLIEQAVSRAMDAFRRVREQGPTSPLPRPASQTSESTRNRNVSTGRTVAAAGSSFVLTRR